MQVGCVHSSQQQSDNTSYQAKLVPLLQASGLEQELAGLQLQGSSAIQSASSQQDTNTPGWVEYRYSLSRKSAVQANQPKQDLHASHHDGVHPTTGTCTAEQPQLVLSRLSWLSTV